MQISDQLQNIQKIQDFHNLSKMILNFRPVLNTLDYLSETFKRQFSNGIFKSINEPYQILIVMHPKQTTVPFNDIQATDNPCELLCQKKVTIISPSPPLYKRAGDRKSVV